MSTEPCSRVTSQTTAAASRGFRVRLPSPHLVPWLSGQWRMTRKSSLSGGSWDPLPALLISPCAWTIVRVSSVASALAVPGAGTRHETLVPLLRMTQTIKRLSCHPRLEPDFSEMLPSLPPGTPGLFSFLKT